MLNEQLINPKSIVVIGGSNDITKPGGKVLKNLIDGNYKGRLYVNNLKESDVQGIKSYQNINDLPDVALAIIAIAARFCPETVQILAEQKNTKAFIILSAGFSEESEQGRKLEQQIVEIVNSTNACLIGPNCIGVMNKNYTGVFTTPVPKLDAKGCDFISSSGATAVFIMEAGIAKGLPFASVYSVGNSAQICVEDVLKYMDENFDPTTSSKVKLLYLEDIKKPKMLLKHASSLVRKGCKISAIKAGRTEAGARAASSHTAALASSDMAVDALFRKASIIRCHSRDELVTIASIFLHKEIIGRRLAIITHAGGPGVMLTDVLSDGGFEIPKIEGEASKELLEKLHPGSSVANPIDFLATGTAEQLATIIDYCENRFDNIDAMLVIFGSPGLVDVSPVYKILDEKMKTCHKPIFPVLPSVINAKNAIDYFISLGRINFPDEVNLGKCLVKVYNTPKPSLERQHDGIKKIKLQTTTLSLIKSGIIRDKLQTLNDNVYLSPKDTQQLLDLAGIPRVKEIIVKTKKEAVNAANGLCYPVVMKLVGPVHKSDVGGVVLDIKNDEQVKEEFERMFKIKNTEAILIQPMAEGIELFIGAKYEPNFGHIILCGVGGIFVEILKDISFGIAPLTKEEALNMIRNLKGYKILQGVRGQEGIQENIFADIIVNVSDLVCNVPEIYEMDINPLFGKGDRIIAVDTRVRINR